MSARPVSERFASLGELEREQVKEGTEDSVAGLKCELKTYESRYNSKGERTKLQVGTFRKDLEPLRDHESAFVVTRLYDQWRELEDTQLDIRSPYVKKALQKIIGTYPGIDFNARVVSITGPLRCLFHYRAELQAYGSTLEDDVAAEHLFSLLEYTYGIFAPELEKWNKQMESPITPPRMDYRDLWMCFRPGDTVFARADGVERVLRLAKISRRGPWRIEADEINFNGTTFGYTTRNFCIHSFDGYKSLDQLKIFPLRYHREKDRIESDLITRGKKFVSLRGTHYRYYDGTALALSPWRTSTMWGEEDEFPLHSTKIKGRVMIDTKTFCAVVPSNAIDFDRYLEPEKFGVARDDDEEDASRASKFARDDFLICTDTIPGFCFTTKRWCTFRISAIQEIEFNSRAFDALLLPQYQKDMIHSLVKVHSSDGVSFDDLITGKGKGMVFLLHGIPGTGKTLTAGEDNILRDADKADRVQEGVADYTKRPLYSVTCGELGLGTKEVEENLSKALRLATTWNAIVLIDEADIFLEARGLKDVTRNGLVSIFLRLLEYYEGILILTTNRVNVFDPAIKSRIHLAIKYRALPTKSRRDLWRVFITNDCSGTQPDWLDEECLNHLSSQELNGRQIKNTVRTAEALAVSASSPLSLEHIDQSLTAMNMFEVDFAKGDIVEEDLVEVQPAGKKRKRGGA